MFETKLTVVGTMVTSPVLSHTRRSGVPVTNFRVATTSRTFDRELGRWVDGNTLYLKVACWRRLAENVASSLRRGDPVMITGNLSTQSYNATDGSRRWVYEVEASSVGPDLTRGTATFARTRRSAGQFDGDGDTDRSEVTVAALGSALDVAGGETHSVDDGVDDTGPDARSEPVPGTGPDSAAPDDHRAALPDVA